MPRQDETARAGAAAGRPVLGPTGALVASKPVPAERARRYAELGYWDDRGLGAGVESAASANPGRTALIDDRVTLTWAQLTSRIAAGVSRLTSAGVRAGSAVVLVAGNTVEGVVAYHSILRCGATAVLLDRRCGPSDLRAAVRSVPLSMTILPSGEVDRLGSESSGVAVINLEDAAAEGPGDVSFGEWTEPDRSAPAVVLFTSGTTNRPKGVVHSLNTLTSGARNMADSTRAGDTSVLYLVSPLMSITGVVQMHIAADRHATLVLDDGFDPAGSLDRANACGATILGGAPVIAERMIAVADARADRRVTLRTLAVGGSMLPRAFLARVSKEYGIDVVCTYGSSEAPNSTGKVSVDDTPRTLSDDGAIMPGTEVRVGSAGHPYEGLLRGPNLMLGYVDQSDNAAAYEGEWYRTGDLLEVNGGRVTVTGRLAETVNRNGLKISLGEIDSALLDHPGITESAAFAAPDPETGERLAVAVVLDDEVDVTLETVVGYLRGRGVATRKLPEQLVIWDQPLPRTASGKVVRSSLTMGASSKRSLYADRLKGRPDPGSATVVVAPGGP